MTTIIGRVSNPGSKMKSARNPLYEVPGGKSKKSRKAKSTRKGKATKSHKTKSHRKGNPGHRSMRKFNPSLAGVDIKSVLINTGLVAGAAYLSEQVTDMLAEPMDAAGLVGMPRALVNIGIGAAAIFAGAFADKRMKGPVSYTLVGAAFAAGPLFEGIDGLLSGDDAAAALPADPAAVVQAGFVPGMRGFVPGMQGHSGNAYSRDIGTAAANQAAMAGFRTMNQLGLDPLPHTFAHPTSMQGGADISRMQGSVINRMQGPRPGMC